MCSKTSVCVTGLKLAISLRSEYRDQRGNYCSRGFYVFQLN